MSYELKEAQELKFRLLAEGITITPALKEHVRSIQGDRAMTPADFASTSGIILRLDESVWVNTPIVDHNPNFVDVPPLRLDVGVDGLVVEGPGVQCPAQLWLPPNYHEEAAPDGLRYTSYAFTHGDRVRISPIEGCSMTCKFCNLPYEFRYRTKRVAGLVDAVDRALRDEAQPAAHVLISGGTPKEQDVGYVRDVYEAVLLAFPAVPVDIMMVPIPGLLDPQWLKSLGVAELSVNLEVFGATRAVQVMRQKAARGIDFYLSYLEEAGLVLGGARVRSMMMVGLEPIEDTLAGVVAIAERGCTPVLSPFRPDPVTPLAQEPPPKAAMLRETYLRANEIADDYGVALGPDCAPCTHNTLTFARPRDKDRTHGRPRLI